MARIRRSCKSTLCVEALEARFAFAVTDTTPLSQPDAATFSTALAEASVDRPWIASASEGTTGTVVVWMRIDVTDGDPAVQTLPIWGRLNPPGSIDPASSSDQGTVLAGTTLTVFGGAGTDPKAAWPISLDTFTATPPKWHEGTQDYFLVLRSPSDVALAVFTAGFVLAGAPGLPGSGASDVTTESQAVTVGDAALTNGLSDPAAGDQAGSLPLGCRPVPPAGLLPADANAAAWLRDARGGSDGSCVLWLSPAGTAGQAPRFMPLFARFNALTDQDPALGPPENHRSSASFHPADGSPPFAVPTGDTADNSWSGVGAQAGGFLVLHTDSNFEISLVTVFSVFAQLPQSWLDSGDSGGATTPAGIGEPPAAPTVALARDTGSSATDLVSSEGTLAVMAAGGARVQYSSDGGRRWSDAFAAREGRNDVLVRQVDALGRASSKIAFTFTLDTRAPATPKLTIAGGGYVTPTNPLVRRADVAVTGVEGGARLEYSAAGGVWTPSWTPVEGQNSVRVRQVDAAGNASRPSRPLTFKLKTWIDAPTVALVRDTGWSSLDRVTSDPRLRLGGVDSGAVPWYSVDGGRSWKRAFAGVEGQNAVLVRQVDTLGNVSTSTRFSFTLDRAAPGRPVVWASWSGVGLNSAQIRVDRVEDGARVEYSADGRTWDEAMPVTPARGGYRGFVRAIDRAGNVSRTASVALSRRI
jgi:hypothetical protein